MYPLEIQLKSAAVSVTDYIVIDGDFKSVVDLPFWIQDKVHFLHDGIFKIRHFCQCAVNRYQHASSAELLYSGRSFSEVHYYREIPHANPAVINSSYLFNQEPCPLAINHSLRLLFNGRRLSTNYLQRTNRNNDASNSYSRENQGNDEGGSVPYGCDWREGNYPYRALFIGGCCIGGTWIAGIGGGISFSCNRRLVGSLAVLAGLLLISLCAFLLGYDWLWGPWGRSRSLLKEGDCEENNHQDIHSADNVTQKLLTLPYYCNTLICIRRTNMANALPIYKQVAIIGALAEGSGIREIERMTGVHRDTIMRIRQTIRRSRNVM